VAIEQFAGKKRVLRLRLKKTKKDPPAPVANRLQNAGKKGFSGFV
jgi:hypothetical protein